MFVVLYSSVILPYLLVGGGSNIYETGYDTASGPADKSITMYIVSIYSTVNMTFDELIVTPCAPMSQTMLCIPSSGPVSPDKTPSGKLTHTLPFVLSLAVTIRNGAMLGVTFAAVRSPITSYDIYTLSSHGYCCGHTVTFRICGVAAKVEIPAMAAKAATINFLMEFILSFCSGGPAIPSVHRN